LAKLKTDPEKDTAEIDRADACCKNQCLCGEIRKSKSCSCTVADAVPQSLNEVVVVGYAAAPQKKSDGL
jgi:hypothetical protein